MKIIAIFTALSLANVIGSTIRTLVTIKTNKPFIASLVSASYFAFYNVVMIYTVADFPLWVKCAVTFGCNLIGVYVVKFLEKKKKPVKMWKIEMAVKTDAPGSIKAEIEAQDISCNYNPVGKWIMFNCYCDTCEQSDYINKLCKRLNGKISAYESKNL